MWFTKWEYSSLGLRQLQLSCECLVLTLKSKVQSYEAQAMVFVNADEAFSTRCWRTSISSEPYQKCRSIFNFCVNPFAVLWNRWSLHFRECVSRARVTYAPYRDFYLFAFTTFTRLHNLSPKKERKTSQFRKVVYPLFLPFVLSILGIFANTVPNTVVSCWLIICYA